MKSAALFLFTVVSFFAVTNSGCQKENDNLMEPSTNAKSIAKAGTVAPGAVYTLSNASSGNSVLIFNRGANGELTSGATLATGGLGTGGGLGSQGALVLS